VLEPPSDLHGLLTALDDVGLAYRLDRVRPGSVLVSIAVPGERWEIEVFEDGHVDVEVFRSGGDIEDVQSIARLFGDHAG
jgi:hypothetical protein